jgi:hypothetical protein
MAVIDDLATKYVEMTQRGFQERREKKAQSMINKACKGSEVSLRAFCR